MAFPDFHDQQNRSSDTLETEQVQFLFATLPLATVISAVLILVMVAVLDSVISSTVLYGWAISISLVLTCRFLLSVAFKRCRDAINGKNAHRWLNWFRLGAIAAGIVWGVAGVLLTPEGYSGFKIYISFVVGGLSAGAATTLAVDRITVNSFLFFVLVPHIAFLALEGDRVSLGMTAMMTLFLLFLVVSAGQIRRQFEQGFHLRQQSVANEWRFRQLLESSPIAARIAAEGTRRVVFANSSYLELINAPSLKFDDVVVTNYYPSQEVYDGIMAKVKGGGTVTNELVKLCSPDQNQWTKWVLASYLALEYDNKPAMLGWFYDITDRKLQEERVEKMAYHDALTGLPNRILFADRLEQALTTAERDASLVGLMFFDLDNFKWVNDSHGHHIGDLLIKAVAQRLGNSLRKTDSVARIGGDEFVILLPALSSEQHGIMIGEKIRQALVEPFVFDDLRLKISSSIGLAVYPHHAQDEQKLLKYADTAMYYAKEEGRNCLRVFSEQMKERSVSLYWRSD